MTKTLAGDYVDASYVAALITKGEVEHGDRFSASHLVPAFAPYLHNGARLKVQTTYPNGETFVRTGTVGITTGWQPAFLLMHRSNAKGSWDVLTEQDEIVAVWTGRNYRAVA